jgi:hypothetical protein
MVIFAVSEKSIATATEIPFLGERWFNNIPLEPKRDNPLSVERVSPSNSDKRDKVLTIKENGRCYLLK